MQQIKVPFGTSVTAPTFRYSPAITAQAFGTMEMLFGHRVILGVGTGEAMNEVPLGFLGRSIPRRDRLIEAIQIMKKLWKEASSTSPAAVLPAQSGQRYMKSDVPIFMSAMGPKMAKIVGEYETD